MASLKTGQEIWQVAAGPSDLSCVSEFLNYGVALIGPGDTGPWESRKNDNALVRRFASKLKEGDILLLRRGVATIHAVGIVASEYQYFRQFDDVNGLALQHGRRVRWRSLPEPPIFDEQVFGTSPTQLSMSILNNLWIVPINLFGLHRQIGRKSHCMTYHPKSLHSKYILANSRNYLHRSKN